jgi:TPR repeat protein
MCGREMEPEEGLAERVGEPAPARVAHEQSGPVRPAPSAPPAAPAPAYTGGIFNLGAPAEQKSRNLDYLLEDDEPRRSKGLVLLVLIALGLAFGLGYLRFRETGIPGFKASTKPAPPPAPSDTAAAPSSAPDNTAATPAAPPASTPDQTPAAPPSPNAAAPSAPAAAAPSPATPAPATQAESSPPTSTPAATPPPATAPSSDSGGATAPASQGASAPSTPAQAYVPKPVPAPEKPAEPEAPAPPPVAAAATPDAPPVKPVKKPAAKPPAAKAEDSVALGEKYLYGRGVPQSCEKGLHYVKPAADQSNPKAMITMGALYATGHCLSRDLPTAYRYFALALRQDPANSALKQNTEMVWGQMTQSERQLAIRLTQ